MRFPGGKCESESVDRNPGAPVVKGWIEEGKPLSERDIMAEMGTEQWDLETERRKCF